MNKKVFKDMNIVFPPLLLYPTMATFREYCEDDWKKIVASITIQGNATDEKDVPSSIEMYIDQRDRDIVLTTNTRTLEEFKDAKLRADIQLAIYYFKSSEFAKMVNTCRNMAAEFPIDMLQKYNLI